jgi:pentose-5-phosphate-3-epimerase
MTIVPGAQGRKLIPDTLEKIAAFSRDFPAYVVAADGGINERTIQDVACAGASRLIVGSDLFSARTTITEKWERLTQLLHEA